MQTLIFAVLVIVMAGTATIYAISKNRKTWYAPYEEPLLAAIGTIRRGGSVPHEEKPADTFRDGEVLSSEDGKELGIVEETETGISVLAKDLSIYPEGRTWYRTGIQIDDLTWSALWGAVESKEKTKRAKEKTEKKSCQYIVP